jgi:hypothetical protein
MRQEVTITTSVADIIYKNKSWHYARSTSDNDRLILSIRCQCRKTAVLAQNFRSGHSFMIQRKDGHEIRSNNLVKIIYPENKANIPISVCYSLTYCKQHHRHQEIEKLNSIIYRTKITLFFGMRHW